MHYTMQVTKKKAAGEEEGESRWAALKEALWYTWPHLTYYAAFFAGLVFFIVKCCMGKYRCVCLSAGCFLASPCWFATCTEAGVRCTDSGWWWLPCHMPLPNR